MTVDLTVSCVMVYGGVMTVYCILYVNIYGGNDRRLHDNLRYIML